jgi:nucleotide-binding universal stress UspA family protein
MKILLAIDNSVSSRTATDEVARRPWPKGSSVVVLTAYEMRLGPLAEPWLLPRDEEKILKAQREQAQELVDGAATKLRAKAKSQLTITTKVLQGPAERVILEEAERLRIDLIILGSHGHRGWERLILGAVAHSVVLHAPCSVEIVRRQKRHKEP